MMEITSMPAAQLADLIKRRELSVPEAVKAQLDAISLREPVYKSFITVTAEEALDEAVRPLILVRQKIHGIRNVHPAVPAAVQLPQ